MLKISSIVVIVDVGDDDDDDNDEFSALGQAQLAFVSTENEISDVISSCLPRRQLG